MAKKASGRRSSAKASSKSRGTVTGMHKDWDDPKKVRVDVELPKVKGKKSDLYGKPQESVVVTKAFAKSLSIGDKMSIETTASK